MSRGEANDCAHSLRNPLSDHTVHNTNPLTSNELDKIAPGRIAVARRIEELYAICQENSN